MPDRQQGAAGTVDDTERHSHVRSLYGSYFFAAWGDRMWEFAAIVFLMEIYPTSLLPPSIFGFAEATAGIVFGPYIGKYIDGHDRLRVIRTSIFGQNIAILLAGLIFSYTLFEIEAAGDSMKRAVVGFIILLGMVAKVSSSMNKIAIHKDWIVVVTAGDDHFRTAVNSTMRRVDLTCSILAPMLVGLLTWWQGPAWTCVFIALWATASIAVELRMNLRVYDQVKALQQKKNPSASHPTSPTAAGATDVTAENQEGQQNQQQNCLSTQLSNLDRYRRHAAFDVSLPYCLLYMSLLNFHGTMVSYLRTLGVSALWLAIGRGSAAFVAIASTFAVPKMVDSMGLVKTGVVTLGWQVVALAPLAAVFLIYGHSFEQQQQLWFIAVIFVTCCVSRFGLWGFDIAQTQMMQNLVDEAEIGAINGGQETVMNFCWLISYTFTMYFEDPRDYSYPALLSFSAIATALLLFVKYWLNQKDLEGGPTADRAPSPSPSPATIPNASHDSSDGKTPAPLPINSESGSSPHKEVISSVAIEMQEHLAGGVSSSEDESRSESGEV